MRRNTYVYEDKEFPSIRALAKYTGVHEKTLTARLRRGIPIDEACRKEKMGRRYFEDKDNVKKSLVEICREQEKEEWLVRNRLKYGYSLNKALNTPKKVTKQGQPIVVGGILYKSVAAALRKMGLEKKESTIRRRLRLGMNPDNAFKIEDD